MHHPSSNGQATASPKLLPLAGLKNPYARKCINVRKIDDLRESIRRDGLLDPLHVSARNNVVSGTCRFIILGELGFESVPCLVHPEADDDASELRLVFAGDTKSDRHMADTAVLFEEYRARHGLTAEQAAKHFVISPATASRYKAILDQPQAVLDAFRAGRINLMHVMEMKSAPVERKGDILKAVIEQSLSPKELRQLIKGRKQKRKPVSLTVGKVKLELPADLAPAELVEALKAVLFSACQRASSLNLGVDALQKIIQGLGQNKN